MRTRRHPRRQDDAAAVLDLPACTGTARPAALGIADIAGDDARSPLYG
ncbi:hypothetical protein [Streptomyces sp. NBC_00233]|nr:hypothetical protein [Streptomyces sp. NBC_00233]MCX5232686.1 hypothetical protein [Streptomyces sp. NBC_00233]